MTSPTPPVLTIALLRELLGWSVRRLADEAGEKHGTVHDLETGRKAQGRGPSYTLVANVVAAFQRAGLVGLKPEHLFPVEPVRRADVDEALSRPA